MLTIDEARARVAEGSKWLDRNTPGWASHIDVGLLDISSCARCALGQVWAAVAPEDDYWGAYNPALGFDCSPEIHRMRDSAERISARNAEFAVLKDAWIEAIADRVVPKIQRSVEVLASANVGADAEERL